MRAPSYTIQANRITPDEVTHERNPGWCCAFVRYVEPATAYNPSANRLATKPMLIVQNDCVAMTVQNSKVSQGKLASITMRAGEIYYPGAVSPGDWVFCWMSDYQDDIDLVCQSLKSLRDSGTVGSGKPLSDWYSGLKFFGRVVSISYSDRIAGQSMRPVVQTITAQSFMEFSSSVYYTETAKAIFTQAYDDEQLGGHNLVKNGLDVALSDLAAKFYQFFTNTDNGERYFVSPDVALAFYLVIILGIDQHDITSALKLTEAGILSNAIIVPQEVATIFNKPTATKLWQLLNVYLGLQNYSNTNSNSQNNQPWYDFAPSNTTVFPQDNASTAVFFKSSTQMKGWVGFFPVPWDNKSLWTILNGYLHSTMNEMYTVLRCDQYGYVRPSFVAREQPFGTQLYNVLQNKKILPIKQANTQANVSPQRQIVSGTQNGQTHKNTKKFIPASQIMPPQDPNIRAMYGSLPRWEIDESMIKSLDVEVSDQNRVNFVQVWGRNAQSNLTLPSPGDGSNSIEQDKAFQFTNGNMVSDDMDIQRAGLRADIQESEFDFPIPGIGSQAPVWARIRADWLFNGHLKAFGTVTLNGVQEPICEGDNCVIRGVVYHIDAVSHAAANSLGHKSFDTVLTLSNGILATSLDNNLLPSYLVHQGAGLDAQPFVPGTTDVRYTVDDQDLDHQRQSDVSADGQVNTNSVKE